MDAYDRLREHRRQHMQNARWYKPHARESRFMMAWWKMEVRSHRLCSRYLWKAGTN